MMNGTARGLCELGLGKIGREYTNTDYNLNPKDYYQWLQWSQ